MQCKSQVHVIINLSFDDLRNYVHPVICQSATRLSDRQGANVGPCETPGLPDTQPEAAHHEYRERVHVLLAHHQTFGKNWQKICGNLLQFEWGLISGCVLRDEMIGWAGAWPPTCHYHKPSHLEITRNRSRETGATDNRLLNLCILSAFYNLKLFNFWFIELLMET